MCSSADDPTTFDGRPTYLPPRTYVLSGTPLRPVRMGPVARRYWQAIPEPERDAIEAAIPEGYVVYIAPGHKAKPGTMDVSLRREDPETRAWHVIRANRGYLTASLVRSVLRGEVVTTDAAGFVTSIEEIA